jgi:hypothetical protein
MCVGLECDQRYVKVRCVPRSVVTYVLDVLPGLVLTACCFAESYKEAREGVCKLQDIRAPILEKTCQYFYYKLQYNNA